MKKFVKVLGIVMRIIDAVYYALRDFEDDGKLNGSVKKDE